MMIERRAFLAMIGGSLLAVPPIAGAQPAAPRWRVGVLLVLLSPTGPEAQAFRQGLRNAGYVEGRDVVIEWRSAAGDYTRLPPLATELVGHRVDVIVADTTQATEAARAATSTIPIVMAIVADPVGSGVVANLSQPGGNITGLSIMLAELSAKRLQLLKDALPRVNRVAALWNPPTGYHARALESLKAAAPSLPVELTPVSARTAEEIGPAFEAVSRARAEALYVVDCPPFFTHRASIVKRAMSARLPVISGEKPYTDEGALMSYGPSYEDQLRRTTEYVDKIFKGARPSGLPIEQPKKFDLVINLKTAHALGLTIPPSLLQRADQVIE
ncbi:MAG TPA: ABC transporter substrate-binding protein [Methylomirabilota bacterium]|nr:ABC transporter substrate-binding protein [Methylomirabilota bacterium]